MANDVMENIETSVENTEVSAESTEAKTRKPRKTKESEPLDIRKMNIYMKLSAITNELQTIGKNLEVGTGNNKYKAVSERDILDAVKPIEEKYGIYSFPCIREVLESNMLENESVYNGTVNKKTTFMTRIMTVYRFVNTDNPTEFIDTTTFSEGIDAQDKGSGKAMTYGDKYALMKMYKISTGDDPDATASEDTNYANKGGWKNNNSTNSANNSNVNTSNNARPTTPNNNNGNKNGYANAWGQFAPK